MKKTAKRARRNKKTTYPIKHWSHSSLISFLRNPLTWYKRYVELVYDMPSKPAGIVGKSGHKALEHFYAGMGKDVAVALGLEYLRRIPDEEVDFGVAKTKRARKEKRLQMERDYLQAISFYLAKPPKHKVLGIEVVGVVAVDGLPLPLKAVSDLVVESTAEKGAVDIVDHKFVASFSSAKADKPLFVLQAIFNYYTVTSLFGKPVRRFVVYECKKSKNANGSPQMRKYVLDFRDCEKEFEVFHRLIHDASEEIARRRIYLPNPSDMFEGEHSFDIYRLQLEERGQD